MWVSRMIISRRPNPLQPPDRAVAHTLEPASACCQALSPLPSLPTRTAILFMMKLCSQWFRLWSAPLFLLACLFDSPAAEPFAWRGYYLTFMRMPVMGLPEWKEAVDVFAKT